VKSGTSSRFWFFNGFMLWGAGLGWLIVTSLGQFQETALHRGPGVVHYEDWSEKVPESQYKRHNYAMAEMMLGLGLLLWFIVAKVAKNETAKAKAKEEYLEAQIQASTAYHRAFALALDDVSRERAASAAQLSAEFRDAQKNQELMSSIYYAASKAANGDAQ
jgi:hypothetical protein